MERVDAQDRVLGVVSRRDAVREGWLHRVGVVVCRDEQGRFLIHRRAEHLSRFPGHYELGVGGAAGVGESYEQAAVREVSEELGVRATACLRFKFLNRSGLSPHWLAVCDAVLSEIVDPDPEEVAWHRWLTEFELRRALQQWTFTPDSQVVFDRYLACCAGPASAPERCS
ncbi:NUDIX domain-containing protein [Streptomyces sp. ME02-6987-2C]|uniref:NUDIX domain-containing protein n=1 Tax=unclassified Streptomyces TaxID=2593676 RepID=UPI0029AF74DB|nr:MULTISPECIES: NUDIX domain-containing protein [unclassified Streptomyces]MDX3372276.1 NUDIX domain-containing protein [Streptomyces sp. ME02-6987-2C]MDX3420794.1 NUDIX domain-containing protein [Streptomyces sp. ME02-6985-2c]